MWNSRLGYTGSLARLIHSRALLHIGEQALALPSRDRVQSPGSRVILCHESEATGLEVPSRAHVTRLLALPSQLMSL